MEILRQMTLPSISIIVPVYNVGAYVEDCIRSVMRQTYTGAMECIIVDDCGTDDSMETVERLVAEYKGPISFQILHHARNRGLSAARNTGMDAAGGDYLFFLDSDDELTDDCIESLAKPLETAWYDIVVGNCTRIRVLSPTRTEQIPFSLELRIADNTLVTKPAILRTHRTSLYPMAWNKLYNKQFINHHHLRFKEGIVNEDNLWSFQIACLASSLFAVDKRTYLYKERTNDRESITGHPSYELRRVEASDIILKEMDQFADTYLIDRKEAFSFFDEFFDYILSYYSSSPGQFKLKYGEFRPLIQKPLAGMICKHRFHLRKYLQDLHYVMPSFIAPYWQYIVIKIYSLVKRFFS